MKKIKILKTVFAFIMLFINIFFISNSVHAANIGESKTLERGEKGYYCVQKWDGSKWIYLTYNQTYYTDNDGQKYIAYCLSPGAPGVGYVAGESSSYDVKINKLLDDDRIWRVLKNGYPNKTIKQLDVETADDAYFATMQAINAILRGYSLEQAKELYSVGKFAINNENFEDIQRRGSKTLNAMYKLIDLGLNGSETRKQYLSISVEKENELVKENENYYSQTFTIKSQAEISEYNIVKLDGMPKGAFISDVKGKEKQNFNTGESFKVMIPTNEILKDINGSVEIKAKQKNYPVYFGEASLQGYQNYALCNNSYSDVYAKADINIKTDKSELKIIKIDDENRRPIEGVKFKITLADGSVNTYKTDKEGTIVIKNMKPGKLIIQEIETVGNYKIDSKERNVVLSYNEKKEEIFENKLQKGNIKIIKVDKDNNEFKLKGVKFEVRNSSEEVIREGVTDDNGELFFDNLEIGEYKIKETETAMEYRMSNDEVLVKVEDEKTSEIKLMNEHQKGDIKIIKIDKDNNEIKLKNVKFELRDKNNNIIREGLTDENGEIFFDNLEVGEYKIIELETNKEYELLNEEIKIMVSDNEIGTVIIENQKKKEIPKIVKTIIQPKEVEKIVKIEKEVEKEIEKVIEKEVEKEVEKVVEREIENEVEKKVIKETKVEVINKELPKTGDDKRINKVVSVWMMIGYSALFVTKKVLK